MATQPSTTPARAVLPEFFLSPVTKDSVLASTPGTPSPESMSHFGRVGFSDNYTISVVHFHLDHPSGTGQYDLELYRRRGGVMLKIATVSADGTSGDYGTYSFTFVDESYKLLIALDYLLLQVTAQMTGAGSKNAAGFVDIHLQ